MRLGDVVRTKNAANNPVIFESGRSVARFNGPEADYAMTHTIPATTPEHGPSIFQPPPHYHIHQIEKFKLRSGVADFYLGLDPKPVASLSVGGSTTIEIPVATYHRFENASKTEDLVLDIHLVPENYEGEERFFRNFFGYLDDCKRFKIEPSLFQLMVFLQSADVVLALPSPSHGFGVFVSRVFLTVVAGWGKWVLGYKSSYEEYHEEKSK